LRISTIIEQLPAKTEQLPADITAKFDQLEALGLDLIEMHDEMEHFMSPEEQEFELDKKEDVAQDDPPFANQLEEKP
jgi:hypothetical protein